MQTRTIIYYILKNIVENLLLIENIIILRNTPRNTTRETHGLFIIKRIESVSTVIILLANKVRHTGLAIKVESPTSYITLL